MWLFPLTYLAIILPALLLGKPLADTMSIYLGQMGVNSALSFNAPSVFQLIPYGVQADMACAARAGIVCAFTLVLGLLLVLFLFRKRLDSACLLAAAVVLAVGVPFLLPYMHDRYFFMADALTLIWACVCLERAAQAVLVELASLSAYFTYFRMQYTCPIRVGRWIFSMGLETGMMLLALVLSCRALWRMLRRLPDGGRRVSG